MSDVPDPRPGALSDLVIATEGGVRVFWVTGETMQALVDRLALVLSERMLDNDELHVTYNSMQNGWQHHPAQAGGLLKQGTAEWTELSFEYSAFVVLRERATAHQPQLPFDDEAG